MKLKIDLLPDEKKHIEQAIAYDAKLHFYFRKWGMQPLSMPTQPENYPFSKLVCLLTSDFLYSDRSETLTLSNPYHCQILAQIFNYLKDSSFSCCEPKVAAYLFEKEVAYAVDSQQFFTTTMKMGPIENTVRLNLPSTLLLPPNLLITSPTRCQEFINAVLSSVPEILPDHPKQRAIAIAIYQFQGLERALRITNLTSENYALIKAALDKQAKIICQDQPGLLMTTECAIDNPPTENNSEENLTLWVNSLFDSLQKEQGDLYAALQIIQENKSPNLNQPIKIVDNPQPTLVQQKPISEQQTQTLQRIKQQTFQEGIQLASSIANLTGNPKVANAIQVIGNSSLSIFNAIKDVKTLTSMGATASLLSVVHPALAIACCIVSIAGLFQNKKNGSSKALQKMFRALSQQIQQISQQIHELRIELQQQFNVNYQLLSYIFESMQEGFANAANDMQNLSMLAQQIYNRLDSLNSGIQQINHHLLWDDIKSIDNELRCFDNATFAANNKSAGKLLRKAFSAAMPNNTLDTALNLNDFLTNLPIYRTVREDDLLLLATYLKIKKDSLINTSLTTPSLFYAGLLRYYYLLSRYEAKPNNFNMQTPMADFVRKYEDFNSFIMQLNKIENLTLYNGLIDDCKLLLTNMIQLLKNYIHKYISPLLKKAVEQSFSHVESTIQASIHSGLNQNQLNFYESQLQQQILNQKNHLAQYRINESDLYDNYHLLSEKITSFPEQLSFSRNLSSPLPRKIASVYTLKHQTQAAPKIDQMQVALKSPIDETTHQAYQDGCSILAKTVAKELSHQGSELSRIISNLQQRTWLLHAFIVFGHYNNYCNYREFPMLQLLSFQSCPWSPEHLTQSFKAHLTNIPLIIGLLENYIDKLLPEIQAQITLSTNTQNQQTNPGLPWLRQTRKIIEHTTFITNRLTTNAGNPAMPNQSANLDYSQPLAAFNS